MRFWHKLASTGVLAVIVLLPFMPLLAMCAPQPADVMQCPPDCPMMSDMASQHGTDMKADDSGSCCTVKSSTPVPVTAPTVVRTIVSVEPATVSLAIVAPAAGHRGTIADISPPLFFDSQAQLCTFLI